MNYHLVETRDRVFAEDDDGIEIAGAYQGEDKHCWALYVTTLVVEITHVQAPPHREHFYGNELGYKVAKEWVELLAILYVAAQQNQTTT